MNQKQVGFTLWQTSQCLTLSKLDTAGVIGVQRAKQLDTTGIPTPFKVIYRGFVENAYELENLHESFSYFRVSENREFFSVDPIHVYKSIHSYPWGNVSG